MSNILITICARSGSKSIPGKNIKDLNGKPLIAYTIACAQAFSKDMSADIELSTDSEQIKKVAERSGLKTNYIRPLNLATDDASKVAAIKHLFNYKERETGKKYDYVLDLDVSSPLRTVNDLRNAFNQLKQNTDALNLFSVRTARKNPYYNMVEKNEKGYYSLVKTAESLVFSRQRSPVVFELDASFYFYRRTFFETNQLSTITDKSLIYVMTHISFDLDEPIDYDFLDYLIKENKLSFEI